MANIPVIPAVNIVRISGFRGVPGTPCTVEVLDTIVTPAGTDPDVVNVGTPSHAELQFYLPLGGSGGGSSAVENVAALRLVNDPASVGSISTLGCLTAGDGGGGFWRWDSTSALTDNVGTVVLPTGHVGNGRWLRVYSGPVYDTWFGTIGTGADGTDDTVALQAAIDYAISLASAAIPARLVLLRSKYNVSSTLQVFQSTGRGLIIEGNGTAGNGYANFTWIGNNPTGSVLHFRGGYYNQLSNIEITTYDLNLTPYKVGIYIETGQFQSPSQGPVSGLTFSDLYIVGGIGTGSCAIQIGTPPPAAQLQVSEISMTRVFTTSGVSRLPDTYVTEYGFYIATGGNTKDMTFIACTTLRNTVAGWYWGVGVSGWCSVIDAGGGKNAWDFWITGVSSGLNIIGGGSEASERILYAPGAGNNLTTLSMKGYVAQALTTTDYFIQSNSSIVLENCAFTNGVAATEHHIRIPLNTFTETGFPSIISKNSHYGRCLSSIIPVHVYDGTGTDLGLFSKQLGYASSQLSVAVESVGDSGRNSGNTMIALHTIRSRKPYTTSASSIPSTFAITNTSVTSNLYLAPPPRIAVFNVTYTQLIANTTDSRLSFVSQSALCKIVSVYVNVTQAFAHPTGTISVSVGLAGEYEAFLLSQQINAIKTIGTVSSELGIRLAPATICQGGYVNLTTATTLAMNFKSTSGVIGNGTVTNLTAGALTMYVQYQDYA